MKGIISNYRMQRHTQYDNHMIIIVKNVNTREKAEKLVGKSVSWKNSAGKEIKGEIKSAHGNKGAVRAIFERGMPGQSVHSEIEIK